MSSSLPGLAPLYPAGKEPLPPGFTEEDRQVYNQQKRYQDMIVEAPQSCLGKGVLSLGMGFGIGVFISMLSSSYQYEDPLMRQSLTLQQKTSEIFKEMGRNAWRSGKGFAKVGCLFSTTECIIESYRAKNDLVNPVAAGFISGGVLARASGPKGMFLGGAGFAVFSCAIDLFLRREPPDDD